MERTGELASTRRLAADFQPGRVVRLRSGGGLLTITKRIGPSADERDMMVEAVGLVHSGAFAITVPTACFQLLPQAHEPVFGCGVPGDLEERA